MVEIKKRVIVVEFNIDFYINIEGTSNVLKGSFKARNKRDIPRVAYEYIKSVKHETGYRPTVIEKVIVNGSEDITDSVVGIENQPIPELDDIFW
jgi:hypothetical protein